MMVYYKLDNKILFLVIEKAVTAVNDMVDVAMILRLIASL
jgi:hypothetical protein